MAKVNKELKWHTEGLIYALKIVKEDGIEALEKEIKMRSVLKIDLWARKGEVEKLEMELAHNLYNSMLSTLFFTLHDTFGFGKKRLEQCWEAFNKNAGKLDDLDYLGEYYVRLEDYGKYLNEKMGFHFDTTRMAVAQDMDDEKNPMRGKCDLKIVCKELKDNGFKDAARFLEKKVELWN